jgi:hypothetical protein
LAAYCKFSACFSAEFGDALGAFVCAGVSYSGSERGLERLSSDPAARADAVSEHSLYTVRVVPHEVRVWVRFGFKAAAQESMEREHGAPPWTVPTVELRDIQRGAELWRRYRHALWCRKSPRLSPSPGGRRRG